MHWLAKCALVPPPSAGAPPPARLHFNKAAAGPARVAATFDPRRERASMALDDLANHWIQLKDLRKAAGARSPSTLLNAASALASGARTEFAAAVMAARLRTSARSSAVLSARDDCAQACFAVAGGVRHAALLELVAHLDVDLGLAWQWSDRQIGLLRRQLAAAVAPAPLHLTSLCPRPLVRIDEAACPAQFPAVPVFFCAALAAGWAWADAMKAFGGLGAGWLSNDAHCFVTAAAAPAFLTHSTAAPLVQATSLALGPGDPDTVIWLEDGRILAITSNRALVAKPPPTAMRPRMVATPRPGRAPYASRWLPDFIRLPRGPTDRPVLPAFQATSVVERAERWRQLIKDIDSLAAVIASGKLINPRHRLPAHGSWLPNHASWEADPAAKIMLGCEVGTYLVSSVLEYVGPAGEPGVNTPMFVEPLGAVPKPPNKLRMISDARRGNEFIDDWGVRYWTIQDLRDLLDRWDEFFGDDFKGAYHNGNLAGCTGELRWSWVQVPTFDPGGGPTSHWVRRLHIGCTTADCLGCCDRAMNGLCIDGHLFRWLVEHFGHKVAGSPLNALMLCLIRFLARPAPGPGELRGASARTLLAALWVDDTVLICKGVPHARCLGSAGGCPTCLARHEVALERQQYWLWLCGELGWEFAVDKRQHPGQVLTYSGIIFDLVQGLLSVPVAKKDKVVADLQGMLAASTATPRRLMEVSGRMRHYSIGIKHTRVHCAHFTNVGKLHPDRSKDSDFDVPAAIPSALHETCEHLLRVIDAYHPVGTDLWPVLPSSLYGAFLQGRDLGRLLLVATYDASTHGWGALVRSTPAASSTGGPGAPLILDELIVGTYPPDFDTSEQVYREAAAGCLVAEAAISLAKSRGFDTRGCALLARNDAASALSGLRKGSSSEVLQGYAMRLSAFLAAEDVNPFFLHVPGSVLITEGIDGLSRDGFDGIPGAISVSGPACGPTLRGIVTTLAARLGWRISIDLFASAGNTLTPRFAARYDEPEAETTDALTIPNWGQSTCPGCGGQHRETVFAFPPSGLLGVCIRKARAEQVRGIFIVPVSVSAPYWSRLLAASLIREDPGYVRVNDAAHFLLHADSYSVPTLAVFAVDFRGTSDPDLPCQNVCPGCGMEHLARGRGGSSAKQDNVDRVRLRSALRDLEPPHGLLQPAAATHTIFDPTPGVPIFGSTTSSSAGVVPTL